MAEYGTGDVVLVHDKTQGGGFFIATVRKAEQREQKGKRGKRVWQYLVHYDGWNKRFDAWLKGDEIKPYESERSTES